MVLHVGVVARLFLSQHAADAESAQPTRQCRRRDINYQIDTRYEYGSVRAGGHSDTLGAGDEWFERHGATRTQRDHTAMSHPAIEDLNL
jgi:hypothetical protein